MSKTVCILEDSNGTFCCFKEDLNHFLDTFKEYCPKVIEEIDEQALYIRENMVGFILVPEDLV